MSMLEHIRLIIYRMKEKGLEIFLVNAGDQWQLPEMQSGPFSEDKDRGIIELDPLEDPAEGTRQKALAIEGDWHDIPSLKKMLKEDVHQLKDQIQRLAPGMENGSFFDLSETLRKLSPDADGFIRELKEILRDRNSLRNL
ncbi:MAG: hypothetical protein J5I41_06215 [Saprospiraceae bacterium]|nr:hypothetical protein [Saprospiraceae bacterium]